MSAGIKTNDTANVKPSPLIRDFMAFAMKAGGVRADATVDIPVDDAVERV